MLLNTFNVTIQTLLPTQLVKKTVVKFLALTLTMFKKVFIYLYLLICSSKFFLDEMYLQQNWFSYNELTQMLLFKNITNIHTHIQDDCAIVGIPTVTKQLHMSLPGLNWKCCLSAETESIVIVQQKRQECRSEWFDLFRS